MLTLIGVIIVLAVLAAAGYEGFIIYKHNIKTATQAVDKVAADATADVAKGAAVVDAIKSDAASVAKIV